MPNPNSKELAKPNIEAPSRSSFLSSIADIEDIQEIGAASLVVLGTDSETDEPIESGEPIASADLLHVQQLQLPEEERMQMQIGSADDGKLYTFGRMTRMYAISGFIVDSNLEPGQGSRKADKEFGGHLITQWDNLYEKYFRMTACLKERRLVRFRWRLSSMYGYILSNIKGIESTQPSVAVVNFTFLCLFEVSGLKKKPIMRFSEDLEIAGSSSYEGLVSAGVAPEKNERELRAILELTPIGEAVAPSIVLVPGEQKRKKVVKKA